MITIITSTLNCGDALEKTARSLQAQDYRDFQWIIADGGSIDHTLQVAERYQSIVDLLIPGPDQGIYDAWNKACRCIKKEWVIFLGAGDVFVASNTLSIVTEHLAAARQSVAICYGNVLADHEGKIKLTDREIIAGELDWHRPKLPYHQGVFHRARFFAEPSPFDTQYRIAADSKFLLQLRTLGESQYIPVDISVVEPGGMSMQARNSIRVMRELFALEVDLGYRIPAHMKALHVFSVCLRLLTAACAGERGVAILRSLKRRLLSK